MEVGNQSHAPTSLSPGKNQYPLYKRLGGPQSQSGRVRKILPPTGIRFPDRPARSESLYRMSDPSPEESGVSVFNFSSRTSICKEKLCDHMWRVSAK
jgi:hypothetical protein